MKKLSYAILILFLLIITAYQYLMQDFKQASTTIYTNGHIITLNKKQPVAEAMLVKNGIIEAIGMLEHVESVTSEKVEYIDMKGATVMPGFIDPHTHFSISMFISQMHDLSGFKHKSNQEVWTYFENIVSKTKKGEWIICKGIDPILVGDLIPPNIAYLDKIAPENPVLFFSQSLHSYWVNSMAYELTGITKETPNPSDHSYYEKDSTGEFTGLIVEQKAIKPFLEVIKKEVLTPNVLSNVATKILTDYAKNGNTTIVSVGLTMNDEKLLILLKHLSGEKLSLLNAFLAKIGILPKRQAAPRHFIYLRHDMAKLLPKVKNEENDFYNIIGIKHWYDGSPYIGSMYLNEPYLDTELTNDKLDIPKMHKGEALIHKDTLKAFIRNYHNKGWQIAIHTQGDAAIKEVLDAFEALNGELDYTTTKHRLEHCLLLSASDLGRMKALNITPSFHINHLYYYGDALKTDLLGEERVDLILPLGAVHEKGIKFSIHADQPMFESKPFRLIQTAVERKTKMGIVIGEEQKIDLMQAIKSMTIDAAWQINMEDKIGSLEKGKYADFIILDKNPFEISVSQLEEIKCLQTFVNGNEVKIKF